MIKHLLVILVLLVSGCLQKTSVEPAPKVEPVVVSSGLKMLLLYENDPAELVKLPQSQLSIIQSQKLRAKLKEAGADFRIWDKDVNVSNETEYWKNAIKLPHGPLPWIWISNGSDGVNGPLPKSLDDMIKLVEKYHG